MGPGKRPTANQAAQRAGRPFPGHFGTFHSEGIWAVVPEAQKKQGLPSLATSGQLQLLSSLLAVSFSEITHQRSVADLCWLYPKNITIY